MASRLAHNKAVQERHGKTRARMDWNGQFETVDIATGHLDEVSKSDAREFAKEIDEELKAEIDIYGVREYGADDIGTAIVENGEFVDWTLEARYTR